MIRKVLFDRHVDRQLVHFMFTYFVSTFLKIMHSLLTKTNILNSVKILKIFTKNVLHCFWLNFVCSFDNRKTFRNLVYNVLIHRIQWTLFCLCGNLLHDNVMIAVEEEDTLWPVFYIKRHNSYKVGTYMGKGSTWKMDTQSDFNLKSWMYRGHQEMNFCHWRSFSEHGRFRQYLQRFRKADKGSF